MPAQYGMSGCTGTDFRNVPAILMRRGLPTNSEEVRMYRARRSWLPLAVQWGVAGLFVLGALAAQAQTSTSVSGSFSVGGTGSGGYPAGSTCPNGIVGISGPAVATLGSAPSLTLNF